jgi:hypothetical protein
MFDSRHFALIGNDFGQLFLSLVAGAHQVLQPLSVAMLDENAEAVAPPMR